MKNKPILLVLLILSPSILLRAMAMDILLPGIPNIAKYFKVEFATSQWVLSLFFLGAGVGQLFFGPLSDQYGRRKILLGSIIFLILSSIACALSDNIYWLMFFRLIQGVAAGGTTDVTMAIIRDLYDDDHTPKAYSYLNSIVGLAPILAPSIGSFLLMITGGWQSSFYFIVLFSLMALFISYSLVGETNRFVYEQKLINIPIMRGYKKIIKDKQFLSYTICSVMAFSCLFMFFSSSAILMIEFIGISPTVYGYYFALNSMVYIIGNIFSPQLQKKFGVNGTILIGSFVIILGALCMLLAELLHGLTVLNLMLPNVIVTLGVGLILGPSMAGSLKHYRQIAGMASAVYGALVYSGSSLLVALVMQVPIRSANPIALTMLLLGLTSVITIRRLIGNEVLVGDDITL